MEKFAWNKFRELVSKDELTAYLSGREYSHDGYFHYTKVDIIEKVLKNREFWISNVSGFNDILDAQQFGGNKSLYYALCFSTGVNENLPLWYLYSGTNGHGGRLQLSKTIVKRLVEQGSYALYELEDDEKTKGKKIMDLIEEQTMKQTFRDVLYLKTKDKPARAFLKYNTMTNSVIPTQDAEQYKQENIGFCKDLIWYYEKETRLLVELIGAAAEFVTHNNNRKYVVTLSFDEKVYNNLKIRFAPEVENIGEEIKNHPEISNFIIHTSGVKLSDYRGTLKMKL